MPETLQILHQSPSNYQMPPKFQNLLNVEPQFSWLIDSVQCDFPPTGFYDVGASPMVMMMTGSDDHFPPPDFAGIPFSNFSSSPVDELSAVSEVTAVIEQSQTSTKRKIEFDDAEEGSQKRRNETGAPLEKSEVKTESCTEVCSENSKPVKDPKTDYVHVRARRGQATDSHSLAERARREKIKKKMQCLQDLVPGCDKVTNKTAMLDEIINYVQSLQRQVEVLSMKLVAMTPRLDFEIENVLPKEFPAYIATFPTAAGTASSVAVNSAPQHHGSVQLGGASATCGIEMPIYSDHLALPVVNCHSSGLPQVQGGKLEMQISEACTM